MHKAVVDERLEWTRELINCGADPNARDEVRVRWHDM